jgi:hypothetical protein
MEYTNTIFTYRKKRHYFGSAAHFLVNPWGRVLLEKPTVDQLAKRFPVFY